MNNPPTILCIDDNHDTLDLLELFLYRSYSITICINGYEGLTKAQEQQPDCIITDIMMPGMNGIQFLNNCRKNPALKTTPVIAVTSFAEKFNRKSLLNIGFSAVITKPVNHDVLRESLHEIFSSLPGEDTT